MTATFEAFDRDGDRTMTATAKAHRAKGASEDFGVLRIDVDGTHIDIFTTPERARHIADAINASIPAKMEKVA